MEIPLPQVRGQAGSIVVANPLEHRGWDQLLTGHLGASFFHGTSWARVLQESYGHKPFYFCRFAQGKVEELLPVMEVRSPVTGRRGVSLPFTDYCSALLGASSSKSQLYSSAFQTGKEKNWRYLECRGRLGDWPEATSSLDFFGHIVELENPVECLFRGLESSVRRGVRKAEAAGLRVEFAATSDAIRQFYKLHSLTRKRHGVPPQPWRFFDSIDQNVLQKGKGIVGLVRSRQRSIAGAVFFHSEHEAIYKFGASDYAFQQMRPNNLLMWEAIKRYAHAGLKALHLGRTSLDNDGLRRFKLGLGAREEKMSYARYDFSKAAFVKCADRASSRITRVFRLMPIPLLRFAGALLYPHLS